MSDVQAGDRIELLHMPDDPDPIPDGCLGTVTSVIVVNSMGMTQIGVKWDNGRVLALVCPPDSFKIIKRVMD